MEFSDHALEGSFPFSAVGILNGKSPNLSADFF